MQSRLPWLPRPCRTVHKTYPPVVPDIGMGGVRTCSAYRSSSFWISFLSSGPELAIRAAATFLSPLVSNSRPPKAVHNCSHFSESLAVRNYPETGFEEVGIEELIGTCGRKTSRHPRGCDGCVTPSVSWSLAMVTSYTRRSTERAPLGARS